MANRIQISCLGSQGRWGNQLFQYSFARKYAELNGATLETPAWIGQKLFGLNDPPLGSPLPKMPSDHVPWGQVNIDLNGYFQGQFAIEKLSRAELRKWFTFLPKFHEKFPKIHPKYAAAHVRRGDYLKAQWDYCIVSDASYVRAKQKFGWNEEFVWVREDLPTVDAEMEAEGMGFIPDFFKIMKADAIFRGNSTFSWWAAALSDAKIYAPLVGNKI